MKRNDSEKILDYINSLNDLSIYNLANSTEILFDTNAIKYFIENNVDLKVLKDIVMYKHYDCYVISEDINKNYINLMKIFDDNDINKDYFWIRSPEENKLYIENLQKEKWNYKRKINKWYIYIIKSWEYYKIWKTKNINKRSKKYITENPNEIEIVCIIESDDMDILEKEFHNKFKDKKHNREWFNLCDEDILFFKSYKYAS